MSELITLREAALDLLAGGGAVLNDGPAPGPPGPPAELAAELGRAVGALKAAAISADGSRVDYAALRSSPTYAAYRAGLSPRLRGMDLAALAGRAARLAFWVNLYNALVLDAVVSLGVRRSVADGLAGLSFFRRAAYAVGGLRLSLEQIEHGLLRANAGSPFLPGAQFAPGDPRLAHVVSPPDPRIHFALNCASRSCPPISAYSAERVEAQLDLAARAFVAADAEVAGGALRLSAIFDWYRADFGGYPGVVNFVRAHLPDDERRRWLSAQSEVELEFKPYDWGLNATPSP